MERDDVWEMADLRELWGAQIAPVCLFLAVYNVGMYELCVYSFVKAQKALYAKLRQIDLCVRRQSYGHSDVNTLSVPRSYAQRALSNFLLARSSLCRRERSYKGVQPPWVCL